MEEPFLNYTDNAVEQMFNRIAVHYDLVNHLLTFGIDKIWRKKFLKLCIKDKPQSVLDIATGTGDLLLKFHEFGIPFLSGLDPSSGMLEQAEIKLKKNKVSADLKLGYCKDLPFSDNQFDLVTVSFGVRNFDELQNGFSEIFRVLKPQGKVRILEFSMPKNPLIRILYKIYLKTFVPLWGRIVAKDKSAYKYLSSSIKEFSKKIEVEKYLASVGFEVEKKKTLSMGIAGIYTAVKK